MVAKLFAQGSCGVGGVGGVCKERGLQGIGALLRGRVGFGREAMAMAMKMAMAQGAMVHMQGAMCASGVSGEVGVRSVSVSFRTAVAGASRGGRLSRRGSREVLQVQVPHAALGLEKEKGNGKGDGAAAGNGVVAPAGKGVAVEESPAWSSSGSPAVASPLMEVDAVTEAELKENGFRSTRRTKLVCTIGPATCAPEQLEALAMGGMNVARLNMCHGTPDWHKQVIRNVRSLNSEKGYSVAIMMDTEGSEIHIGDFDGAPSVKAEVRHPASHLFNAIIVSVFLHKCLFTL